MLKTCCQLMKDNQDMQYSWYSAVDMAARTGAVTRDDKAVIYDLGTQLGRSNVQGQLDLLEMTEQKLDIQIREAQTLKKTKGKMYAGLGFSIGTVLAILLI
jgi:stage III sporulation protein AB